MYDDAYTRNNDGELAVRTVSTTGDTGTNVNDVFTRDNEGKLCLRTTGNGGGGGGAVNSVNGKTGNVVLDAEDVGALPDNTPIPSTAEDVGAVPQYSTMPTASASNVGEIAQFSGTTIPDIPESVTIEQTTGSGLTDLVVNADTFIGVEQPTTADTFDFTATVEDSMVFTTETGNTSFSIEDASTFKEGIIASYGQFADNFHTGSFQFTSLSNDWTWWDASMSGTFGSLSTGELEDMGIVITGTPEDGDRISYVYTDGTPVWEKDGDLVDITSYGISYSGTVSDGDVLTVSYVPGVPGITNGYFYKNTITYTDPTATIEQTTGSGLTDLAINVDTFVETEQPSGDEEVEFTASIIPAYYEPNPNYTPGYTISVDAEKYRNFCITNGLQYDFLLVTNTDGYTDGYWSVGRAFDSIWVSNLTLENLEETFGITITNFTYDYGPDALFTYIDDSVAWSKDNETVDISTYGITYSGTPANADVLTVTYTAPEPSGYAWKQINVQPGSSSGGGDAGIEWKTKVDLPGSYAGDEYSAAPYYTITGGLPDGEYEFYFATKTSTYDNTYPYGETIFKMKLKIDNSNTSFYGLMGYVFDGNYMNDGNTVFGGNERTFWGFVLKNGQDLIFYTTERPFATAILSYNSHQTVPECFKLSAIKNVETGQEYIAVGNVAETMPAYDTYFNGNIVLKELVSMPSMPNHFIYNTPSAAEINSQIGWSLDVNAAEIYFRAKSGSDEFYARAYRVGNNEYEQEIFISTGKFANWTFTNRPGSYGPYLYFGGTPTFEDTVMVFAGAFGATSDSFGLSWVSSINTSPCNFVKYGKTNQFNTITANQLGGVIQYIGETDANYTKGYFYTASGTPVVTPESLALTPTIETDFSITVDIEDFLTAMSNVFGWTKDYIRQMLGENYNWNIEYDYDNSQPTFINLGWTTTADSSVLSTLTVTYTGSQSTGSITVECSSVFTPEATIVQNPSWDRIDVQPAGSSTTSISVTLAVADWSSNTQTVTVTGVAADSVVFVSPAPASASDYASAGILCTAQAANSLTFTCDTTPTNAITVNVVCL